jgi:hypothetical protein
MENKLIKYFKSSQYSSYFYKLTKYYISLIYIRTIEALWKLTEGKEDIIFHQKFNFNEAIEEIINELNKKRI